MKFYIQAWNGVALMKLLRKNTCIDKQITKVTKPGGWRDVCSEQQRNKSEFQKQSIKKQLWDPDKGI